MMGGVFPYSSKILCIERLSLAYLTQQMLTPTCVGDKRFGCKSISCGGDGFSRVSSRGGEGVTI